MSPYLQLGLTLLLVALTGFFVAAEYAMIRVRRTRINELEADPDHVEADRARAAAEETMAVVRASLNLQHPRRPSQAFQSSSSFVGGWASVRL